MAGYSGTPLVKKLGIKEGFKIKIINPPVNYFGLLGVLPARVKKVTGSQLVSFIHLFLTTRKEFEHIFPVIKKQLEKEGMIWISWPKKSSKFFVDLDENKIREYILKQDMVDVKVCAIDEVWSGLKIVYRLKDR